MIEGVLHTIYPLSFMPNSIGRGKMPVDLGKGV